MAIIEITDMHRDFHVVSENLHALHRVTINNRQGEFVSIMGTSGSGKSTLLNILGCLDTPTSGIYRIDGQDVQSLDDDSLALIRNRKIGFVFQNYNLLPRTTALENVELPLIYNRGISRQERLERAIEALRLVGLADRMQHTSAQLSGGQQQRVAIARALAGDPVLILADEATGNLDTRTSYEIMTLFQELHAQGKTIAFVTHEPDIAAFTTRIIRLRDGRIIQDTPNTPASAKQALQNS